MLEGYDLKSLGHNTAAYLHLLVEAKRIAFADRDAWIGDPRRRRRRRRSHAVQRLRRRAAREIIRRARGTQYAPLTLDGRSTPDAGEHPRAMGDTVYLTAADSQGNVISLIQSLYETSAPPSSPATPASCCRTAAACSRSTADTPTSSRRQTTVPHAHPAMVLKDGRPWFSFGVMGGDMQPQGHVQVLAQPDRLRHERAGGRRGRRAFATRRGPGPGVGDLTRRTIRPEHTRPSRSTRSASSEDFRAS